MNFIFVFFLLSFAYVDVFCAIRKSKFVNKLTKVKPVGGIIRKFVPLTELPPIKSGRRHMTDCRYIPQKQQIVQGPNVLMAGDYYDEGDPRTLVTVKMPDHIDRLHYQITTQVPYYTVGAIDGIGYNPTTKKLTLCEQIYIDHLAEQYSAEYPDQSYESIEMARLPDNAAAIVEQENNLGRVMEEILE